MTRTTAGALALAFAIAIGVAACTTTSTSDDSTTSETSGLAADLLRDPGLAVKAVADISKRVGSENPKASDTTMYPEYLIVEAQDPGNVEHIDRYEWRDGAVDTPEPVHLSGSQEDIDVSLYPLKAVHWEDLPAMVRAAEDATENATPLRIEQARANYVIVDRTSTSDGDSQIVVRIYIDGPRRSGSVELTPTGEITNVSVS